MTIQHSLVMGVTRNNEVIQKTVQVITGAEQIIDEAIPVAATDLSVAFALATAKCQSFFMLCDQNLTVKTNSSSTPADTFTLVAGQPLIWYLGMPNIAIGDLFSANVTSLFVTNAAGVTANLQIRHAFDPT